MTPPVVLTIAGSDSGGGAGIQADLKTFAARGVHGTSALTAITAQNTTGVTGILELPVDLIRAQVDAIVSDLRPAAVKTGMLSSSAIIECAGRAIQEHALERIVVDPVMVAKGGARLLREDAVEALGRRLLPLATVITPNLPETEVLLGHPVATLEERLRAARELHRLGPACVVVKGGHADDAVDVFFDGERLEVLAGERLKTANTHGSGCVFASTIAAGLASGAAPLDAVREAKRFVEGAIRHSLAIGGGHGPVNPMWEIAGSRR
jgi:hydroxymethylpyrimidine/phosphomethylpyrimidine kinase